MERFIDFDLKQWAQKQNRKPLLVRGARQVGKTHAVRKLGAHFEDFVEINFELMPRARSIFTKDLDPVRILQALSILIDRPITPGKTLLFFDEIQAEPQALISLRYFYEMLPQMHVIAAGSLLDFAIEQVGIPVGRVLSLYMYPLSYIEFIHALGHKELVKEIIRHSIDEPLEEVLHHKALELFGLYLAIGGMPEAIASWNETKNYLESTIIHHTLVDTYRQDFTKYAKKHQLKYLEPLFKAVPQQLSSQFKYAAIEGDFRKRDLAPCLDLLETAGIVHRVQMTAAHGIPLGAEVNLKYFKTIFIDVALAQTVLGLNIKEWLLNPLEEFVNKGPLVEACIGQELLAYSHPSIKTQLFFWQRISRSASAEIDYLMQEDGIIPIEVKSGKSAALFSMQQFLEDHKNTTKAIRFSVRNYGVHQKVLSYPLYAVAGAFKSFKERCALLS